MSIPDQLLGSVKAICGRGPAGALAIAVLSACAIDDPAGELGELPAFGSFESHAGTIEKPRPGAAGIGDPLFPTLGNGGYEVLHYQLDLRYETPDPAQPLDGTVRIFARATHALSQFNLDFAGDSVGEIRIGNAAATFVRDGEDLVVTPPRAIARGEVFVITAAHFVSTPKVASAANFLGAPFFRTQDGTAWAGQPNNAHEIFPCNDHPSNKAPFTFRIDVPEGITAVASGIPTGVETAGGRTVFSFEHRVPMATELLQVVVGAFTVVPRGTSSSGAIIRDVVPTRLLATLEPRLAVVNNHVTWMEDRVGGYPFPAYGSLPVQASLGFALETQTLSLYQTSFFNGTNFQPVMIHELAHQWFGDHISPMRWSDVWLNEGHATWYERTFQFGIDSPNFVNYIRSRYLNGNVIRSRFGPVAGPVSSTPNGLFNPNVYDGGAVTLYALRQTVGDQVFQQIEREWTRRFGGLSASTADFIALASEVAQQDLTAFLTGWLYGSVIPPMPGHPEWVANPGLVGPAGEAQLAAALSETEPPHDPQFGDSGLLRY